MSGVAEIGVGCNAGVVGGEGFEVEDQQRGDSVVGS